MQSPQKTKTQINKSQTQIEAIPNDLLSMDLNKIREFM